MRKNKAILLMSGFVSLLFLVYVCALSRDIIKSEDNLAASPNVVDVTHIIQTKLLVTPKDFKDDLSWASPKLIDDSWKVVSIPKHRTVQEPDFKNGNFGYYRIHIPKKELTKLSSIPNELFLGLQYINFSTFDVYVNGVFYRSNTPGNYVETLINIPLIGNQDNLVAIKGLIKTGDTGINHRGKILVGKGAELNELHRKTYKAMSVLPLIFILCKGSVFFVFTLIFLVMKVEKYFEKFLMYGFFVIAEDVITGDITTRFLNLNQQVYLFNFVNIGIIIFLFLFLSDVLGKKHSSKKIWTIIGGLTLFSTVISVDFLHTSYVFNVNHLLQGWNISMLLVLLYFLPRVFKLDKVLTSILSISFILIFWSTFFSPNVGLNLKMLANLLLFFMVAYQTFVLFRREQNLLQDKQMQLAEQEKDVAIGKTAALLAHDVRRPLEQMNLILNTISAGHASDEFLRTAKRDVDFSITSVTNQINDIMNYSRQNEIQLSPVSFYKVLSGALKQVMTINKNVHLVIQYDFQAMNMILGDESRLSSVLTNLLSNSVEAIRDIGEQKNGILKLSTSIEENSFFFRLSNDGPSIPSEIIPQIFKPLFTHGKVNGTGLGLASVAKIIKEHNGQIGVNNLESRGVEFTLSFKMNQTSDEWSQQEFKSLSEDYSYSKSVSKNSTQSRQLRIFLLDDDSQVYDYFQFITKNLDFEVELVFASEYEKAKEIVHAKRFDVYILDFDLGDSATGLEFYKENLSFLSSEVVLHSNRDKLVSKNANCLYETKPISIESFISICENAFSKRLKILLVDDSDLTLMAWELFHGKHNLVAVSSPEKALEVLVNDDSLFDICVVDYYFDNSSMNGEVLARKIMEIKNTIKVVIASNSALSMKDIPTIEKNDFEIRRLIELLPGQRVID